MIRLFRGKNSKNTESEAKLPTETATESTNIVEENSQTQSPVMENSQPAIEKKMGWFGRLRQGLARTRHGLSDGVANLFLGKKNIDDELFEELETVLLTADVGVDATTEIIADLTKRVARKQLNDPQALQQALTENLLTLIQPCEQSFTLPTHDKPTVILMVGVNGAGKTTTMGKLANRFKQEGKSVLLAAGDTFRAAAIEQLQVWGARNNVPVVAQHKGADSASVIFDAMQSASAKGVDVVIADTAGRLHTQDNLMRELEKVIRVIKKQDESAPHEVLLVLDAGIGQNALRQTEEFKALVGVTGVVLTKLDGTAKGGVIFAIAKKFGLPIRYIGVGEAMDDLRPFQAREFIDALFSKEAQE